MKLHKLALAGVVAGSLGLAPATLTAQMIDQHESRNSGNDTALTPHVPGVIADPNKDSSMSRLSREDVRLMEQALANDGYDPGTIDGIFDDQTQAAIVEFQSDRDLIATGIVDAETGELLGIIVSQSS